MVVLPVTIAKALDTRVLCRSKFVVVGAIAVAITANVPTLLLAIIVRAALGIMGSDLALRPVSMMLVLVRLNLIAKLDFDLEVRAFLDTLELHAIERTIVLFVLNWASKNSVTDSKVLVLSFLPALTNLLRLFL
jgi:hypothetical protein